MKSASKIIRSLLGFFVFYGIIFIPFPFNLFPYQLSITQFIWGNSIHYVLKNLYFVPKYTDISSDSTTMYVLIALLFLLSVFSTLVLWSIRALKKRQEIIDKLIQKTGIYYLALMLIKYGFDKIFKAQFYIPEPNTLYTPLGYITKDLLYWSTIGTSHSYNVFMGMAEVIPAIFLLFKRTRLLGLCISLGVLVNVVAVNFSFDISVKIYSMFLCVLCLYLLSPYYKKLGQLFLGIGTSEPVSAITTSTPPKRAFVRVFLHTFLIGIIFMEAGFPYIRAGNLNDDRATRPYLHGAYEVTQMYNDSSILVSPPYPLKRIFIHRHGYMIFQNNQDEMEDFKLQIDTVNRVFVLTDYELRQTQLAYHYQEKDSLLSMQYRYKKETYRLVAKTLNWRKLPALQNEFHWAMNE